MFKFGLLSLVAQMVENLPAMPEIWVQSLGQVGPWRKKWQTTPIFLLGEFHGHNGFGAGYLAATINKLD